MTTAILLALFNTASSANNLPPRLLEAVCFIESRHNAQAMHINDGGEDSIGICQVHESTARWLGFKGTKQQLLDPKTNIKYAAKYLAYQMKRYHGNTNKALVAYNHGNAKGLTKSKYSDKVIAQWVKQLSTGGAGARIAYRN